MKRSNRRDRGDWRKSARPSPPAWPVVADPEVGVTEAALRLILSDLTDDPHRTVRLAADLFRILEGSGVTTVFGIVAYLLTQVTDGLVRGNGSIAGAVDAVTSELAAVLIEDGAQ